MADNTNGGWESAPVTGGGAIPASAMALNDAQIQQDHPNWPNGGTAAQVQMETRNQAGLTSPAGAVGITQGIAPTISNVEKALGRKLDLNNPKDALDFHRFVIEQNLSHFNEDPTKAVAAYNGGWNPQNWNNPETQQYVQGFSEATGISPQGIAASQQQVPDQSGWESAPTATTSQDGWESAPQQQPSARQQRANAFLQQATQAIKESAQQVQGLGETQVSMITGTAAMATAGFKALADLATGTSQNVFADMNKIQQAMTFEPRTPEGKAIQQKVSEGFGKISDILKQGAETSLGAVPFIGEDLAKSPVAKEVADTAADVIVNVGPLILGLKGAKAVGAKPTEVPGAPAEAVTQLAPDEAQAPSANNFTGPPRNAAEFGPERPPIVVDSAGNAVNPLQPPEPGNVAGQARQAAVEREAQFATGDLFPSTLTEEGTATPFNPNRLAAEDINAPVQPGEESSRGMISNRRQEELPLGNEETIRVTPEGIAFPESAAPYRDIMESRAAAMQMTRPEELDPTSGVAHPAAVAQEAPRSLAPDEFTRAVQTIVDKAPDRFSMPADMDRAYEAYVNTVRDAEGNVLSKSQSAKRFVEAVQKEMTDQRLADHPTVKANQARVDNLAARLADAQAKRGPTSGIQKALDTAQKTLDKSKENIGKTIGNDPRLPYEKDGVVNMFTFGHLPEMFKSIGAVLKAIHGMVFRMLDRVIPSQRNLDTYAQIKMQGIKDFVNKQATHDWSQTVNEKPMDQLGRVPGLKGAVEELNPHSQEELSPEQLKEQFNTAPDLSGSKVGNALRNNLLQGGLMLADFSNHPLVKYTTDGVAKAFRSADKWARENLLNKSTGLAQMVKNMPLDHYTAIRTLMEAYEGVKEFSENELRGRGYSVQQIGYYKRSLELQKEAFDKYNASRVAAGQPPVTARLGHIAGYFTGDFKMRIEDAQGRLVAVLGHNNRGALLTIAKRFQELHPDGENLKLGKPMLRKGTIDDNSFHGMMNILNELSKTNADVDRILQAYRDIQMANTMKLNQMANRGKFKSAAERTVGGAEGSKLWQSMQQNAIDGGKMQLKYLDSVNRWSEFQNAFQKAQDFIKDPEVNAPNAKSVSQAYLDNQMHRNLGELNKFTNSFMNGVAEVTGVGPTQMRQMANFTKTGLLNMFVGLGKFSHSLVTMMQPFIGIPEVNSILKARGGDFGLHQATALFKSMMDNRRILESLATKKPISDPFLRAANEYARQNDTFNTSQFNMGNINHPATKLGTALHINVTAPESGARAFTYMYYVNMLKDADVKGTLSDREIFGTAHNAVQKVMADYSREAAAPVFNKMGFLGDLTRMLTTFKMNQISQTATAAKMFRQGHFMPMVTALATSIASAGVRGFIGYNIANGALGQLTTWATKNGLMNQPTNLDQIILHMLHGVNKGLADALNFGATSALGIDMTGSLSHADDIPDDPLGTLLPEGNPMLKILGSARQFAEHPNVQRGKALLYDVLPNSLKGPMENLAYTNEKGEYFDPHTGNLVSTRTPLDQAKRYGTFRPLEESKMRLQAETARGQDQQLAAVRSEITNRMLSDADSVNGNIGDVQQFAQKYARDYYQHGQGDPNKLVDALVQHLGMNKHRNIEERQAGIPSDLESALKYRRSQELK